MEKKGEIFVFHPQDDLGVNLIERDPEKMQEVYDNYSRRKSLNVDNEMKHNLFVISIIIIIIVVTLLIYHITSHKVYKDTIEKKNKGVLL